MCRGLQLPLMNIERVVFKAVGFRQYSFCFTMQKVDALMNAEQILTELSKHFICPLTGNTYALKKSLVACIEKTRFYGGVVDMRSYCKTCEEADKCSWVSGYDFKESIDSAYKFGFELLCPTCHTKITPLPKISLPADHVAIDSVKMPHTLSFAQVDVLQIKLEMDRSKIQILKEESDKKDETIKDLRDARDILIKELRDAREENTRQLGVAREEHITQLRVARETACAATFVHCIKNKLKDGEDQFLLQLQSDQPENFCRVVRQKVIDAADCLDRK